MEALKKYFNIESIIYIALAIGVGIAFFLSFHILINRFSSWKTILLLLVIVMFFEGLLFFFRLKEKKLKHYLIALIGMAIILHIINIFFIAGSIEQISDFNVYFKNAILKNPNFSNAANFYHWALLSKVFHFFSFVFGKTQLSAILFISMIVTISSILVFILSYLVTKNNKLAFVSGLIYTFWPSNLLYTNIFANEHMAALFMLVSIILFIIFDKGFNSREPINNVLLAIVIGISLSILKFFKPVSIVLIIAFLIYVLLYRILYQQKRYLPAKIIINILIIIFVHLIVNYGLFAYLDHLAGQPVNRNPTPFYLYMGLSPQNNRLGFYNNEMVIKYLEYLDTYNKDYNRIGKKLLGDLRDEYSNNLDMLPKIVINKYKITWRSDMDPIYWVSDSIKYPNKLVINKENLIRICLITSQFYYVIILGLYLIGIIYSALDFNKNKYLFLLNLIIFGFSMTLLISETQGRYKIILYPFIALMAAYGLQLTSNKLLNGGSKV